MAVRSAPGDFDQFARSAAPGLERAANLIVLDRGISQDLVQEAFIRIYRHWGRLRNSEAATAYARRTLVRLAHRHLRRQSTRNERPSESPMREQAEWMPETDHFAGLSVAITALPERQREALVLRYYLDMSVEQVAAAMGCSAGTVKSQVSRALATVRDAFETMSNQPE
jgi:RNA polymerase sigma-70 factor (sigma-E family)